MENMGLYCHCQEIVEREEEKCSDTRLFEEVDKRVRQMVVREPLLKHFSYPRSQYTKI